MQSKKSGLLLALVAVVASIGLVGFIVQTAAINDSGEPIGVVISTITWTRIPIATDTFKSRDGIFLNNPNSNTGSIGGFFAASNSSFTVIGTGFQPIEIAAADTPAVLGLGPGQVMWLFSNHTAPETVYYQQFRQ